MTAAAPAAWPGSRALLAWWQELAPHRPQRLWVAHLLLHRLEALVCQSRRQPLPALEHSLLDMLSRHPAADLPDLLHLDRQILTQLLHSLLRDGLLQEEAGTLHLTAEGQQARAEGSRLVQAAQRRTFYFRDCSVQQGPPRFLPLLRPPVGTTAGNGPAPLDLSLLQACIERDAEWKSRHHFPPDVEGVLPLASAEPGGQSWRRVVLDSVEEVWLTLIQLEPGEHGPGLVGFGVRPGEWALQTDGPVLTLGSEWAEVLPEMAQEPGVDAWQQAWQAWCQPRSVPPAEAAACRLERVGHRLVVHAPHRLVERLRAARSDAVKQGAWLLAGSGPFRPAALIQLVDDTAG